MVFGTDIVGTPPMCLQHSLIPSRPAQGFQSPSSLGLWESFLCPWCWPSAASPGAPISEAARLPKFPRGMHSSHPNTLFWPPTSFPYPHKSFPVSPSCKLLALVPCLLLREPSPKTAVAVTQEGGCCNREESTRFLAHWPCCISWPGGWFTTQVFTL